MDMWEILGKLLLVMLSAHLMLEGIGLFRFWNKIIGMAEIILGLLFLYLAYLV